MKSFIIWTVLTRAESRRKISILVKNRILSFRKYKPFILETSFLSDFLENFVGLKFYSDHFFVKTFRFEDIQHFPRQDMIRPHCGEIFCSFILLRVKLSVGRMVIIIMVISKNMKKVQNFRDFQALKNLPPARNRRKLI